MTTLRVSAGANMFLSGKGPRVGGIERMTLFISGGDAGAKVDEAGGRGRRWRCRARSGCEASPRAAPADGECPACMIEAWLGSIVGL